MAVQLINVDGQNIEVMNYDFSKKEQDLDSGRNLQGAGIRRCVYFR